MLLLTAPSREAGNTFDWSDSSGRIVNSSSASGGIAGGRRYRPVRASTHRTTPRAIEALAPSVSDSSAATDTQGDCRESDGAGRGCATCERPLKAETTFHGTSVTDVTEVSAA
jgi:hypothetical protein